MSCRIGLIHAVRVSIDPIEAAFRRLWPEARTTNLLDDSLSADLAEAGALTPAIVDRFRRLGRYTADCGADAILFACSAFGPAIEAVRRDLTIPVLKPNEAMVEDAVAAGARLGLLVTFEPTIASMIPEIEAAARERGEPVAIEPRFVPGAMAALNGGHAEEHDARIADAARELAGCDAVILAQFSMARAKAPVAGRVPCPVLTTPDSAVAKLKRLLGTGRGA